MDGQRTINKVTIALDRIPHSQSVHGLWDFHHTSGNRHLDGVSTA